MTVSSYIDSVNKMSRPKDSYHHGDLRQSLVKAAIKGLNEYGIDGLSMRKLADAVGVSRSAAYHHFRDKRELLCAIAEDGFHLQDSMLETLPEGDTRKRFSQLVKLYLHFATTHPEQYDLMYGREIWKSGSATSALDQAAKQSFKLWLTEVAHLQSEDALSRDLPTLRLAQVTWGTLHGLCRLINDGIYADTGNLEEMGETAVEVLLRST